MHDVLLSTKLHVPRPHPALVYRPRLAERLEAGLRGRLTLVSAPAGYGKTTLVSDWLLRRTADEASVPLQVAWLSLDASDNDLARFLSYLIAALQAAMQQSDPDIGAEILPVLESEADLDIERLLTALINDIVASGARVALVLDDYHTIREFSIHRVLDFLLDHLPPPSDGGVHVILLSRTDPPVPLGRLRVQRELTEIRETDLRFTVDEAGIFLNELMALALSGQEVADLGARTEGWIAALHLAALHLADLGHQDRSDRTERIAALTGSDRYLIDYLGHEVMSRQPEEVRTFLLRTSILEQFSASLCDALLDEGRGTGDEAASGSSFVVHTNAGRPSSQSADTLEYLQRAHLFLVPLDDEARWYRYHRLFGDFLRRRLHGAEPALVPELYLRASQWYERQGMVDEAIEHALAGEGAARAARLMDEHAEGLVFEAQVSKLIRLASRIPEEERCRYPRLCIYYAWALQFEHQLEAAESALACAEAQLDPAAPTAVFSARPAFSAGMISHHARAVRVYIAVQRHEPERVIELARAALEALPGEGADEPPVVRGAVTLGLGMGYFLLGQTTAAYEALQSALPLNQRDGNHYAALSCTYYLMRIDRLHGALGRALAHGRQGLLRIEQWSGTEGRRRPLARVLAHIRQTMAFTHYERDELDEAARYVRLSTDYYELVGSPYQVRGHALLVDLHWALGEIEAARGCLDKLAQFVSSASFFLPEEPVEAIVAQRRLLLGQMDASLGHLFADATHWADTVDPEWGDRPTYRREHELFALAQVRVAQGRAAEVLPLLERLVSSAQEATRQGQLIANLALQAVAYHVCDQIDDAQDSLSHALALGEPEGYVRTFIDHGAPMADLLQQTRDRGISVAYVNRLLSAIPGVTKDVVQDERRPRARATDSASAADPAAGFRPSSLDARVGFEPLNDREMQILRLLAAGLTDRQIAEELYLSINTVKWHNRQMYSKLDVGRRSQAVARAQELGLL